MTQQDFNKLLGLHRKWLRGEKAGRRAELRGADLSGAKLWHVGLENADLSCSNLTNAILRNSLLNGIKLRRANLFNADLSYCDLRGADLDFSCLPLSYGGLHWKIDKRIFCQIAYHLCSMDIDDPECIEAQNKLLPLANQFHRVMELGEIRTKRRNSWK